MEDAFTRFVGLLAGSLDDPREPTERLAARLALSRSHFDRLVTAAAGEPPEQLRRRVLLERAAYLLRTTDATVLDVAVDSGYSSHEAFTRAFRRAFGLSPAYWRRVPAGFLLETPSGVHFYPPGGLRLTARKEMRTMEFVPAMVDHHLAVLGRLLAAADGADVDRPIEISVEGIDDEPTIRSLLARLVGQLEMWSRAMANQPYDLGQERDRTLPELTEQLAEVGPAFAATVRRIDSENRYDETFVDLTGVRPYVFTAAGMIAHILTYAAHRRTLVAGALASAGIDVDDDPLLWFNPPE